MNKTSAPKIQSISLYVRTSAQGSAIATTAVCGAHMWAMPKSDEAVGPVAIANGNQELSCVVCGHGA